MIDKKASDQTMEFMNWFNDLESKGKERDISI